MVIKDENGKVAILLDQDDILRYVFDKCGFEVGIAVKDMTEETEEDNDEDLECELSEAYETIQQLELENKKLNRRNEDLEENSETLEKINKKLQESLKSITKKYDDLAKQFKIQKNIYIEYLNSQGLEFASKKLKEFDE